MQKKSFWGLMYKDWYLGKRAFIRSLIFVLIASLFGIALVLSMNYGNLRLLPEGEIKDMVMGMYLTFVKYMPLFSFATLEMCFLDEFVKIENKKWQMFRMTTPISVYRYTGAKYALTFGVSMLGVILSVLYICVINIMTDSKFSINYIAIIFLMAFIGKFLCVMLGIFVQLFNSIDKAGVALCVLLFVIMIIIGNIKERSNTFDINMDNIDIKSKIHSVENSLGNKLGIFIILYFGIYILGYFLTALIYKRREK